MPDQRIFDPPGMAAGQPEGTHPARARAKRRAAMVQPSPFMLLSEMRAAGEALVGAALSPFLALAPRGDGHPVLVLPSFMGNDASTSVIRTFLRLAGFRPYG